MSAIKAILAWVFRNVFLFVIIVTALIAHTVWSQGRNAERAQDRAIATEIAFLNEIQGKAAAIRREAERTAAEATRGLADFETRMRDASIEKLKRERTVTEKALAEQSKALPSSFEESRQVLARDTEAIGKSAVAKIDHARLERQLAFLDDSIEIARGNGPTLAQIAELEAQRGLAINALKQQELKCAKATEALQAFDEKRFAERLVPRVLGARRKLAAAEAKACQERDEARTTLQTLQARIASFQKALENGTATINTAVAANLEALQELERQSEELQVQLEAQLNAADEGLGLLATHYELAHKARSALLILLAIIFTPFLIRTLFYYVLAPAAERRASIRITMPGYEGVPLLPTEPSRISLPVALEAEEELLIRQDYLQTSPIEAEKATQWLLDLFPVSTYGTDLGLKRPGFPGGGFI